MAGVFLSYDRRDNKRAKPIAGALEKAGHSVWWDLHVRGGAQFAKVIEEALRQADAVVVLWSSNSVESAWVRDEAAAGRDTGRLIPVALDGTEPPLGFRQYQTIDLARWSGRGAPEGVRTLIHAIEELAPSSARLLDSSPGRQMQSRRQPAGWMMVAALSTALALAALFYWQQWEGPQIPTVAVAPADNSAENRELARDLMVSLDGLSAARAGTMRLLASDESGEPDLRFEVGSITDQGEIGASVMLTDGRDQSIMWSRNLRLRGGKEADLKQQLSYTSAGVLACALEAISATPPIGQTTLKLFLTACASGAEDPRNIVQMFRQVVKEAPRFPGGWKGLLATESVIVATETYPESRATAPLLRRHIAEARKLDPQMPEAFSAELFLIPGSDIDGQMELVSRAVALHPDNPGLNSQLSLLLSLVGRAKDAVAYAKRATELDPVSPDFLASYVTMLGWTGQREVALSVLGAAEKRWPGASSVLDARWRYHLRFGDPREALRLNQSGAVSASGLESYLAARIDPTQANIDRAVADAAAQAETTPRAIGVLIQTLAEFGREEEAYDRLLNGPRWDPTFVNQALFRPGLRNFRRDVRMMQVARKSGLVDYWMKSGKWPDFCSEPDLPYNCRQEAAKLTA